MNRKLNPCLLLGYLYDPSLGRRSKSEADSLIFTGQMIKTGSCHSPQMVQKPSVSRDVSLFRNSSILPEMGLYCRDFSVGYIDMETLTGVFKGISDQAMITHVQEEHSTVLTPMKVFIIIRKNICNFNL